MRTFTIFKTFFVSILMLFLFNMVSFAQCPLFEDFENMSQNAGYAGKEVTTTAGKWWIVGYSQMDQNDRRIDEKSIRLRAGNSDTLNNVQGVNTKGANVIQMLFDKPQGVGEVSFYYGSYSTHSGGVVSVEYSKDGGTTWLKPENNSVTSPKWADVNEMKKFTVLINEQVSIRIRIIKYKQSGSTSVNVDNICVTDFVCENCVAAPVFNPPGGNFNNPVNVTITSNTPNATIRYTLDGTPPDESSTVYANPISITETKTLKAKAWKAGMEESAVSTANYVFIQGIPTLAALRALAPAYNGGTNAGTAVYTYSGQAVVTQVQDYNNVRYIQDETAAIMIFDKDKKLTSQWLVGDKITDLSGTLTNYFGMIEFVPVEGECEPIGWLHKVPATTITAAQLDADPNNSIQAKVVIINNVQYTQTGNFAKGTYYNLKENNMVYDSVVYTDKYEADYIAPTPLPIPTVLVNIKGVILFKGGLGFQTKNRIVPLDYANNVVMRINDINKSAIKLAPNPAQSFVEICTGSNMKLEIYSLLGTKIGTETLYEGSNTISIANYPAGVYMMKFIDTNSGQTVVQKLVIR